MALVFTVTGTDKVKNYSFLIGVCESDKAARTVVEADRKLREANKDNGIEYVIDMRQVTTEIAADDLKEYAEFRAYRVKHNLFL